VPDWSFVWRRCRSLGCYTLTSGKELTDMARDRLGVYPK
jgi:hypothetical protein